MLRDGATGSRPQDPLGYLLAMKETARVTWTWGFTGWPQPEPPAAGPHGWRHRPLQLPTELRPSKSLDSDVDGRPWRCDFDRNLTPCSIADLGAECAIGPAVGLEEVSAMLEDPSHHILPYTVSPETRSIVCVQHEAGHDPAKAPFLFVGQRQRVRRVVALPWPDAAELAGRLPEAESLGPVMIIQMMGRCGSTLLCKALDWLDLPTQGLSEPDAFCDVHQMLERRQCSREEAVGVLRSAMLLLIHQRRAMEPSRPVIVIKNRSLTACWRAAELVPEALPEAKQVFQWRAVEDVVGSLDAAAAASMAPATAWLHARALDGALWRLGGVPIGATMLRFAEAINGDPLLAATAESSSKGPRPPRLDVEPFIRRGSLGFQALNCILAAQAGVSLGRRGLWAMMLRYEDLMRRRSAVVRELLETLGWAHHAAAAQLQLLGTPRADAVFLRDAHAGGGLQKASGTTLGGGGCSVAPGGGGAARANAHLPEHLAQICRGLMARHAPLQRHGYDLAAAVAAAALEAEE